MEERRLEEFGEPDPLPSGSAEIRVRPARPGHPGELGRVLPSNLRHASHAEVTLPTTPPWQAMQRIRRAMEASGFDDTWSGILPRPGRVGGRPYLAGAMWLVGERSLRPDPRWTGRFSGPTTGLLAVLGVVGVALLILSGPGAGPSALAEIGVLLCAIALAGLVVLATGQPFLSEAVSAFARPRGEVVDNDRPVPGGWTIELRAAEVASVRPWTRYGASRYVARSTVRPELEEAVQQVARAIRRGKDPPA